MRIIKFRAWNAEKKIMVYKNEDNSAEYWDGVYSSDVEIVNYRFDPDLTDYEWMQFTGIHYKNGVEIYEGDIVEMQWDKDDSEVGVIIYSGASFNVRLETDEYLVEIVKDALKYIGNIHENPELL